MPTVSTIPNAAIVSGADSSSEIPTQQNKNRPHGIPWILLGIVTLGISEPPTEFVSQMCTIETSTLKQISIMPKEKISEAMNKLILKSTAIMLNKLVKKY